MAIDAFTLISRVIERAAQKSTQAGPSTGLELSDEQRADMLVETLATQLLAYVGLGPREPANDSQIAVDLQQVCDDQLRRNRELARALGACDCWGELTGCEVCHGRGAPGWRRPEAASFNRLVSPVVEKLKHQRRRVYRHNGRERQPMSS